MRMNCVSTNKEVAKILSGIPASSNSANEGVRQHHAVGAGAGNPAEVALPVESTRARGRAQRGISTRDGEPGYGPSICWPRGSSPAGSEAAQAGSAIGVAGGAAELGDRFFQRCLAANRATTGEAQRDYRVGVYE